MPRTKGREILVSQLGSLKLPPLRPRENTLQSPTQLTIIGHIIKRELLFQVERKKVPIVSTAPASKFGLKNFLASASTHMEKERLAQEKMEQPTSNKPKRSGFGPSALAVFASKT